MKKTFKHFLFASLIFATLLAGCDKPKPEPEPEPEPETPKSTECVLKSFKVNIETGSIEGFVDQTDKSIEISYMPNEYEFLAAATAECEISDKATISPDPASVTDYTAGEVKFTVTAEDGTTKSEYTVFIAAAEFNVATEKVWTKTYGELGLAASVTNMCGVGFVSVNNFATSDLNVYDLSGAKVGTLNIEGIPGLDAGTQLAAMSNDENGVLVAMARYDGTYADGSTGKISEIYGWLDGWNSKPTLIYKMEYECNYMSVSGDVKGDFVLTIRTGAANPQMHHVLAYKGGKYFKEDGGSAATWAGPMIQHPGNDGCWGQLLSFFTGNPEDGFVCWDSVGAAEMGDSGNASSAFYVYDEGLSAFQAGNANEVALRGGVNWTTWDADGRWFGYGNFSTGHVRAFVYNGQKYVIACSGSWPCNWITIQKANNLTEDDEATEDVDESKQNYLLETDIIEGAAQCYPCCAYVYDPATGTGHVIYLSQSSAAVAYDIKTNRI